MWLLFLLGAIFSCNQGLTSISYWLPSCKVNYVQKAEGFCELLVYLCGTSLFVSGLLLLSLPLENIKCHSVAWVEPKNEFQQFVGISVG